MEKPNSVEDYLAALPDDARAALEKLRRTLLPDEPESHPGARGRAEVLRLVEGDDPVPDG
jgi:hypothetical protein